MRRNSELLKAILSFMQEHESPTLCCKEIENGVSQAQGHGWPEIRLHIALLKDMGLVTECTTPAEYRLTSAGYDVVESADPIEQMKMWAKLASGPNTPLTPTFAVSRHPLPPAARSQRLT